MAEGAPGFFEFVTAARDFFDGPQPQAGEKPQGTVIDVEPTVVEVVDAPSSSAPPPADAPRASSSEPGFTLHVTPAHLLERVRWVVELLEAFHHQVKASADQQLVDAWRLWYRDILVWSKRISATQGTKATKADYDRLDAILQRLGKWQARLAREHQAEKKGDGLPWWAWGAILVGGAMAAKSVLSGFLSDLVS